MLSQFKFIFMLVVGFSFFFTYFFSFFSVAASFHIGIGTFAYVDIVCAIICLPPQSTATFRLLLVCVFFKMLRWYIPTLEDINSLTRAHTLFYSYIAFTNENRIWIEIKLIEKWNSILYSTICPVICIYFR